MEALERMTSPRARAVRDGRVRDVSAHGLVPGDVVVLATGDVVGADLRLVDVAALRVNEATLTGESEPVAKTTEPLAGRGRVARRRASEHGVHGNGRHVRACPWGSWSRPAWPPSSAGSPSLMQAHDAGRTPLQQRLASLGRLLALVAIVLSLVVFAIGRGDRRARRSDVPHRGEPGRLGHPGGRCPSMVTVALALGARRMAGRRALIRTLPAVETLGSVERHLHRQDRHAHPEPDAGGADLDPRRLRTAVDRRRLRPRRDGDRHRRRATRSGDPSLARGSSAVAAACNDATAARPRSAGDAVDVHRRSPPRARCSRSPASGASSARSSSVALPASTSSPSMPIAVG